MNPSALAWIAHGYCKRTYCKTRWVRRPVPDVKIKPSRFTCPRCGRRLHHVYFEYGLAFELQTIVPGVPEAPPRPPGPQSYASTDEFLKAPVDAPPGMSQDALWVKPAEVRMGRRVFKLVDGRYYPPRRTR